MKPELGELKRKASSAATMLKILANEKRLLVLCNLLEGERSAGELEQLAGLSQSALSQHLARLRAEGIVDFRRDAQRLYYRVVDPRAKSLIQTLYQLYCGAGNLE